ncbi:MAG: L-2-hydroxyglutarate oxidase [Chloroflexi bacterium]|nr:L-2-hydroxyglutarate oxidase [Chloroflexota bacterium]
MKTFLIIGGGLVGLATAYKLGLRFPDARITVLEKESEVCKHQSGNNSGVLHTGLYYAPGSYKARLCVAGQREMIEFCQANNVPHDVCGKLVVATNENELSRLKKLLERGMQNGLQGLQRLDGDEIQEFEPHARGVAALRVPQTGIADYPRVGAVLVEKVVSQNSRVVTNAKVINCSVFNGQWTVQTTAGDFQADYMITCAGLYSDRVSEMFGEQRAVRVLPFRGEYFRLKKSREHLVRNLIYPVADPRFPFLGVHFTRMMRGGVECGPNAVLAFAREGYRKTQISPKDLFDALTFSGFWNFMGKHWRIANSELRRSVSKKLFAQSLQKLVPEIQEDDLEIGGAGVRAQAMYPNGNLVDDFLFVERANALHVLNAPSPAATASLAIGSAVVEKVAEKFS